MGAAAAVAIMRRREREVVDDFRAAGATSPATAQSYSAIGLGESLAVRRLHDRAVIREAASGMWYLDEEVWDAVRRTRRRVATVMLTIVVILFVGFAFGFFKS
ncbi:MAG: hypothetical protein ABI408_00490 [Gemmatimonadaceae bacterium]